LSFSTSLTTKNINSLTISFIYLLTKCGRDCQVNTIRLFSFHLIFWHCSYHCTLSFFPLVSLEQARWPLLIFADELHSCLPCTWKMECLAGNNRIVTRDRLFFIKTVRLVLFNHANEDIYKYMYKYTRK
jgi:hypothetical protein